MSIFKIFGRRRKRKLVMSKSILQDEYLRKLNDLNRSYGMAIKYDPEVQAYYLEDQVDFDYDWVDCIIDPITSTTKFKMI